MTVIEKQYMDAVISIARSLNKPKEIDWEQRRYEIAKDCLAHAFGNQSAVPGGLHLRIYDALESADKLIELLREPD